MKAILKRNVSLLMAAVMALGMLAGCGMKPDDAKDYVQATLDAGYKADFADYAKITDSTEEEAQKLFDENIDTLTDLFGFEALGATEETMDKYRELLKEIFAKVKYTVGDAKETDDGFEVEVKAEPMEVLKDIENGLLEKYQEEVASSDKQMSDDERKQLIVDMTYDLLSERLAEVTYGEEQTVTVHVTKDSNNVWSITEDDLEAVDSALFTI